ncbi:two-component response regulator ARR22-like [Solanum stenotomum]|uniref:two-component response regulator ARR22-like n=1 Tax=Solanum stenotomum TaxID=172797 RepID=UPI0020D1656A|nr:two-component response regulator ARR22-like [Solanum stenotomum]
MSSSASSSKGKRKLNAVKKLSVLIVANDDISQNSYILCLQKFGVETLGVRNGFMAFNIHDKTQMSFDLILMSYTIPIMDGIEATKKLRSMEITTMIVGITTPDDNEEYRKKFMEAGLDECYEKPLTKEILQSLVEKISNKV